MINDSPSDKHSLPFDALDRIDRLCRKFDAAWRAGDRPSIEQYLDDSTGAERDELLAGLLAVEVEYRRREGQCPTAEEYRQRFPTSNYAVIVRVFSAKTVGESHSEGPGTQIGPYKLLQELGEGGMGTVFMAEQDKPVQRRVALKLITEGMDSKNVLARFEAERQALTLMDHPNIVRIFDAGTTSSGRPYFVMDLVKGIPITTYCDQEKLSLQERLELFASVCAAVQHAHQKGIIHRDLKPSNVLVALYDSKPVPKVIDFGLAKATDRKLTERTMFTHVGSILGTPAYMAPEQAEVNNLDVDTRADIYALGVILYELLTGSTPFTHEAFIEMLRLIREVDPPMPSARLSSSGELLAKIAAKRKLAPKRLTKLVSGELDWIVMKCLEKERGRRYDSANGLATDIQRYLNHEPVLARRPSAGYRMRKWIKRKPAMAAAVALCLMIPVVIVGLLWWRAASLQTKNLEIQNKSNEIAHERDGARTARDEEKRQRGIAEERKVELQLRADQILERKRAGDRLVYAGGINQAQRAWIRFQSQLTLQLLDSVRPERTDGGLDYRGWEWHYLKRLCHSERLLLKGHTGSVNCLTYSRDGAFIASGSSDGTARLWDTKSGQALHVLKGHLHSVKCAAFTPDSNLLATGSEDALVKLWDVATGKELATLNGHVLEVNSVAFDPRGKLLATAGSDATIQLYDLVTKELVTVLQGHSEEVRCVTFSPDSARLASAGTDLKSSTVRLWDVPSGKELKAFDGNTSFLYFTSGGSRLAFVGTNDLRIVDLDNGEVVQSIVHPSQSAAPTILADRTDNLTDGRSVTYFANPHRSFGYATLSADGNRIGTVEEGMIQVWDALTGNEIRTLSGHTGPVALSPDGHFIANPGKDNGIRVWSVTEYPEGKRLGSHKNRVASLTFSPDGKQLASGSHDQSIKIWDAVTGKEIAILGKHEYLFQPSVGNRPPVLTNAVAFHGHASPVLRVAYSPDGLWLASAGQDKTLRVWEIATSEESLALRFPAPVTSTAWSPDGKRLAAASLDSIISLFDFPSGQPLAHCLGHAGAITAVAFMEDGKLLASTGRDKTVRIWEVESGQQVHTLEGRYLYWPMSLAISPDGSRLAVAGHDKVITVWDTATWKEVRTLWGHTSPVDDLAFTPDSRRLASAAGEWADHTVKLWDMATGLELLSLLGDFAVSFSPDGSRLAVGMPPNDIHIYQTTPVDSQPYRTARLETTPADEDHTNDDGKLHVLGYFTARRLAGIYGAPKVLKPAKEGSEFLIVVASLPERFFVPSEKLYLRLAELDKKEGDKPSRRRENIAYYNPKDFRLVLPNGEALTGEQVGVWPMIYTPPGFSGAIRRTQSSAVRSHERVALAVAWSVAPRAIEWPIQVQFNDHEPVPMPQVHLMSDPRLEPDRRLELAFRVELAWKQVKTDKYAEAVAEAALVARDKDADAVTIYNAGCVHSLAVAQARQDATLMEAEREQRAEGYAATAVDLLRQAITKGFADVKQYKEDKDLNPLRQRADFQKLLGELQE